LDLHQDFPAFLEKAIDWASDLESQVLESGVELTMTQRIDAQLAGVKEPARIRVLVTSEIPMPADPLLQAANDRVRLVTPDGPGLTVGYGVIIRRGHEKQRRLLVHEFVHVAQYERLGGMDGFLHDYLAAVIRDGYENSPLEQEATQRANAIVRPGD
jgi:hypothetical protein